MSMFIEVSFEVANKVGGIYAVLESKAREMIKFYGKNYLTIGYFDSKKYLNDFEPEDATEFKGIFSELAEEGITCYYGKWNIEGSPRCILIDVKNFLPKINDIKLQLWNDFKIDSLRSDEWYNIPIAWSYASGKLIEKIVAMEKADHVVAQFHEWLSGAGLLYLKKRNVRIGTVFTTHATVLGRTIAGSGESLNNMIEEGNKSGKQIELDVAYKYGVEAKHLIEMMSASNAEIFSTVSETTANESRFILGKYPDFILINGLDMKRFPSIEELSYMHKRSKSHIMEFLTAYFQPYYNINLDDPRIMFISGRYEFHNKGIDMFIDALADLNKMLKTEKSNRDVFAFILVPSDIHGENFEVLENIILYKEMKRYLDEVSPEIKDKLLRHLTMGGSLNTFVTNLLEKEESEECKKMVHTFRSRYGQTPKLCAFNLNYDEGKDAILTALRDNGLLNREEDKVKVIFYPTYISPTDRLLSMNYSDVLVGCSIGIFPSYYEPWGYTALEAAARGVITITSNITGYGQFIEKKCNISNNGIYVIDRINKNDAEASKALANVLRELIDMNSEEIAERKRNARNLAMLTDWSVLSSKYFEAHNAAVKISGAL